MWDTVKLIDACEKITQGPNPKYKGDLREDLRVLKTKNLYDTIIHYENADCISEEAFNSCAKAELQQGDVLLAIVGQGSINKCNVFDNPTSWRFIFTRALGLLRTKIDILDPYFLKAFLQSKIGKENVDSGIGGTSGQQVVTTTHLKNIRIPLPPLEEQKRIVAILDEAFAGIDTAIANTEKNLANARELFGGFLNSIINKYKDEFEKHRLGSIVYRLTNGYVGATRNIYIDKGIPYLLARNVKNNVLTFDGKTYISKEFNEKNKKSILKEGDVLLVQSGHIGHSAVVSKEHAGHNCHAMIVITPKELLLGEYLSIYFNTSDMKSHFQKIRTGSTVPHLTCKLVKEIEVPVPTLEKQGLIIEQYKNLQVEIERLEKIYQQKINSLKELKQSLLQKAFSGELTAEGDKLMDKAVA